MIIKQFVAPHPLQKSINLPKQFICPAKLVNQAERVHSHNAANENFLDFTVGGAS